MSPGKRRTPQKGIGATLALTALTVMAGQLVSPDLSAAPASATSKKPAAPNKKGQKGPGSKAGAKTYVRIDHRVRVGLGLGSGNVSPAIINEAGSSWMINSFFAANADPGNTQAAINIAQPKAAPYISWFLFVDYAFRDRWFVGFNWYNVSQKYSRAQKTSADFFAPASTNRFPAAYEGVRLLRYQESLRTLDLTYLHPVLFRGFKVGGILAREWYREEDDLSHGSYVQTRATALTDPSTRQWSQGGAVRSDFRSSYWSMGLALRYQLFDWLGFHYRLHPRLKRSGDMTLSGAQLLTSNNTTTNASTAHILAPVHFAHVTERGIRHRVEATLTFCCRYNLSLGLLREDWKRQYNNYVGATFASGGVYNAKTTGYGLGETANKHPGYKQEIYLKLSVAAYFGRKTGTEKPTESKPPGKPPQKKEAKRPEFGLAEGALAKLGKSKYFDQMFNGIKEDFVRSGMDLTAIAGGFQAKGLKLQKIVGPDGKTTGLRIALDGTIGFKIGSAKITPIAARLIAKVARAMKAYPETRTKIGGHVDCCASRKYSLWLSQARADSAKKELISQGLASSRIVEAIGYADDRMLFPVRRLEPRNRRVEFVILTK